VRDLRRVLRRLPAVEWQELQEQSSGLTKKKKGFKTKVRGQCVWRKIALKNDEGSILIPSKKGMHWGGKKKSGISILSYN